MRRLQPSSYRVPLRKLQVLSTPQRLQTKLNKKKRKESIEERGGGDERGRGGESEMYSYRFELLFGTVS